MSKAYLAYHRDSTSQEACAAARRFADECLVRDGSLFTSSRPVWTAETITDFHRRVVEQGDFSNDTFLNKLDRQLAGADSATIQLAAEVLYVNFLAATDTGVTAKRSAIDRVLSGLAEQIEIPDDLGSALAHGIARIGQARMYQWHQIGFLILLALDLKRRPESERAALLSDPWRFKDLLASIEAPSAQTQQQALLHLIFPETFEPIVSVAHKARIVDHFSDYISTDTTDLDRQLDDIRQKLSETYGSGFGFYDDDVRSKWQADARAPDPWDEFIHWAKHFRDWDGFDAAERDYKLRGAETICVAKEMLLRGDDWTPSFRRAFRSGRHNLVDRRSTARLLEWISAEEEASLKALTDLWTTTDLEMAVRGFLNALPMQISGRGMQLEILSFLMMATDPTNYPVLKVSQVDNGYRLTEYGTPPDDHVNLYLEALGFLDQIIIEAKSRGLQLRDRLDAQCVLRAILSWNHEADAAKNWSRRDRDQLRRYRRFHKLDEGDDSEVEPFIVEPPIPLDPFATLADELLLPVDFLQRISALLADKRQVIFYGPPGTGKTFVARQLAETIAGDSSRVALVQFHPSYAYEDFVQGYRPAASGGFELRDGPLVRIADAARNDPDQTYVLLIDEINRGNIAKVFGELYFLLEYRDHKLNLQYSDEPFALPKNLHIIGTMNTADRSIALIDAALRRRFYFVPFMPSEAPIDGLLRRWLIRHKSEMQYVADYVDHANEMLDNRDSAIGPSYFMKANLDEDWLAMIWDHAILPYVAEHFFGQEERVDQFRLASIMQQIAGTEADDEAVDADGIQD